MGTTTERLDDIAVLHLVAKIDGLAAQEFERTAVAELDAGLRLLVIDFEKVMLITSAGIRVLLILRKRVGSGGGLVLCGVSDRVKTLLDIAGLSQHLAMARSRDEAVAGLKSLRAKRATESAARPAVQPSALSRLLVQLLGGRASGSRLPESAACSDLATRVLELLDRSAPEKS
jgi:stage II sporulation protein AA (anti-sigma F factor antagonist)